MYSMHNYLKSKIPKPRELLDTNVPSLNLFSPSCMMHLFSVRRCLSRLLMIKVWTKRRYVQDLSVVNTQVDSEYFGFKR